MNKIIKSLLDCDFYKLTMLHAMWLLVKEYEKIGKAEQFQNVKYVFKCRTLGVTLAASLGEINKQVDALCSLSFLKEELEYLDSLGLFESEFIEFLANFKLNRNFIEVKEDFSEQCGISIVAQGALLNVMYFEVFVMAIVNEVAFNQTNTASLDKARKVLHKKIAAFDQYVKTCKSKYPFSLVEFGTRRRASFQWQQEVLAELKEKSYFFGTSNMHFARTMGLPVKGTMGHEWFQLFQGIEDVELKNSQAQALSFWKKVYGDKLNVALTDVIGMKSFLRDLTQKVGADSFAAFRHDSGSPDRWAELAIDFWKETSRLDNKALVFSDGLNEVEAIRLHEKYGNIVKTDTCIGTNLTNDMVESKALNVVMKLVEVNGKPCAKLSDSAGKTLCKDQEFVEKLKEEFNWEPL